MRTSSGADRPTGRRRKLPLAYMILFALLAAMTFLSDLLLDVAMNVELVSMLLATFTLVYRRRALYIIYLYVILYLTIYGFTVFNVAYLYVWLVLWGMFMLLPRRLSPKAAAVVYPVTSALFGLAFGALYAPGWAIAAKLNWSSLVTWWMMGLPADVIHAVGNLLFGTLILPLSTLLKRLETRFSPASRVPKAVA